MKVEKFKVLLYLKKSSPDKSGKAPIMGRITLNRSISQFSCKLSCNSKLWNPRESRLNGKSREAVAINAKLEKLLFAIHAAYETLIERNQPFDATDIKNVFQGNMDMQMTLLQLMDRFNEEFKKRLGVDRSPRTLHQYLYTRKTIDEFIKKKFNVSDLAFGQLSEQFIRDYQYFIINDKKLSNSTLRHYLCILKKICKIAYKEGYSDKFYFAHFRVPKPTETTPRALSRLAFEKIRDLEIHPNNQDHILTRDLFVFSCYTGTAYIDAVSISQENIQPDDNGDLWLKYNRKKNGLLCRIKLLPEAIELINKYRDETRDTLFPFLNYTALYRNLQGIRALTGIKEDLSYHVARHSFASLITLEGGVPIETISKMLGHNNMKTTQIYARVTPKRLFEDMDKYIEATNDLKLVL